MKCYLHILHATIFDYVVKLFFQKSTCDIVCFNYTYMYELPEKTSDVACRLVTFCAWVFLMFEKKTQKNFDEII